MVLGTGRGQNKFQIFFILMIHFFYLSDHDLKFSRSSKMAILSSSDWGKPLNICLIVYIYIFIYNIYRGALWAYIYTHVLGREAPLVLTILGIKDRLWITFAENYINLFIVIYIAICLPIHKAIKGVSKKMTPF